MVDVFQAAKHGWFLVIQRIGQEEHGLDRLRWSSTDGCTAAHTAACFGHIEVLWVLHEVGAGDLLSSVNAFGETPAHFAAFNGHADIIRMLHELGGDSASGNKLRGTLSSADKEGYTPSHLAAAEGHWCALQVLHELEYSLRAVDNCGHTPAQVAASRGHGILALWIEEVSRSRTYDSDMEKQSADDRVMHIGLLDNGAGKTDEDEKGREEEREFRECVEWGLKGDAGAGGGRNQVTKDDNNAMLDAELSPFFGELDLGEKCQRSLVVDDEVDMRGSVESAQGRGAGIGASGGMRSLTVLSTIEEDGVGCNTIHDFGL